MDEFNDLDTELAKLKQELASGGDEWTRQFHFPASDDYWKRRQDEEKILWQKKLELREEEKKALEEKLKEQKSQIEQYNNNLANLEKRIGEEARKWEDRFKARETELLLEKNRLLWEEKVRDKENENHTLLSKVSELNSKIGEEKNQQLEDREKSNDLINTVKETYEDKIKSYVNQVEVLKSRVSELEKALDERILELKNSTQSYDEKIKKSDEYVLELSRSRDTYLKESTGLKEELTKVKEQNLKSEANLQESLKGLAQQFAANFYSYMGPIFGILNGIKNKTISNELVEPIKDSFQRLENETQLFMSAMDVKMVYNNQFTFGTLLEKEDTGLFEKIAGDQKIKIKALDRSYLKKEVLSVKPQFIVVSAKNLKYAYKIKSKWPFMPVVIFGDIDLKTHKQLLTKGFEVILPPYVTEEVTNLVYQTATKSIAWPEYWGRIKAKRNYLPKIAAVFAVAILCFSGYYLNSFYAKSRTDVVSHFVTPYPQPTNIAFDGQNIWVCDWFGQSIYKHKVNGDMKLLKIFQFPEKHITTLTWAGGFLWSADAWTKKIYKHNLDDNLSVLGSFPAPNAAPSGLAGDGKVLWSCDSATGMIYSHKLDDKLTIEQSYKSPGSSPSGLYFDGDNLWSIDSKTNRIYRHNINNGLAVENEYAPVGYEQKGFNLSGIVINKDKVWICSERMGEIQGYKIALLKRIK